MLWCRFLPPVAGAALYDGEPNARVCPLELWNWDAGHMGAKLPMTLRGLTVSAARVDIRGTAVRPVATAAVSPGGSGALSCAAPALLGYVLARSRLELRGLDALY